MLWILLGRFLKPHRRLLAGIVVLQVLQALAMLFLPELSAKIIDQGVAVGNIRLIVATGLVMLAITVAQILCSAAAVYFSAKAAMSFGRDLRAAVFNRVGAFSEREVSRFGAPSLITRTTNDVQQLQTIVMTACTMLVAAPILSIGGIVMAIRLDARLSSVIAVSVPVMMIALGFITGRMVPLYRQVQTRIDDINRILREQLSGMRVVRAFVREDAETARFAATSGELADANLQAGRLGALIFPVIMIVLNVSSVAVVWLGAYRIDSGSMQVGTLIAFLTYLMQILIAVMMATFILTMLPRAAVSAERIGEVLETQTSVSPPLSPARAPEQHGLVEFRDVAFAYPGADAAVVSGINLIAQPGTTLAIIGRTGSGKSTLINLIPRLFDVTAGAVLIDGLDVRDLAPDALWSAMGLVPQKSYLFSGTVRSNLQYGNPDATEEEMWRALTVAQAGNFVFSLEGGLDARVAQGGANLSGGQRQRLAIARALVRRTMILLFDDSFSALDTATEARLRQALVNRADSATIIIVAQRVSSVMSADQIVVLDNGRVAGCGTHAELLGTSTTYREIVASQLSAEDAA